MTDRSTQKVVLLVCKFSAKICFLFRMKVNLVLVDFDGSLASFPRQLPPVGALDKGSARKEEAQAASCLKSFNTF